MNYSELPIEERMEHAKNYALILKDELEKTPEMIIEELGTMFNLPFRKAKEAYLTSIDENQTIYKKANKSKLIQQIISLVALLIIGGFYLYMAQGVGWLFYILAIFFGLAFLGLCSLIYKNFKQNLWLKHSNLSYLSKKWYVKSIPYTLSIFLLLTWYCWINKNLTPNDISIVKGVLGSEITIKKTKGKSPRKYYSIDLRGYEKNFRFYSSDYQYCFNKDTLENYKIGDNIEVEIVKSDSSKLFNTGFFNKVNEIVGYRVNGETTINYALRFKEIKEQREIFFFIGLIIFGFNFFILLVSLFIKDD